MQQITPNMKHRENGQVTTALLLAAGTGSRLHPLTDTAPKCLTELNGSTLIERFIHALQCNGIKRLVVVVGYLDAHIKRYLNQLKNDLEIEYIHNPRFQNTNNIYSLWLARATINEPFLLAECDLVFDPALLKPMMTPDRVAVSQRLPWMNGSVVSLDLAGKVSRLHRLNAHPSGEALFKTVNIYSFSLPTWRLITTRLQQHIDGNQLSGYYETVLTELIEEGRLSLEAVFFDEARWYEVDTLPDLRAAEIMFPRHMVQEATAIVAGTAA
ncbi:phosphocholine cytidylyltransferase family protein [bacterium]|jgi:L-glutamine-phosphate cytidylyltransferase|nr:phosphocholine cytidylyltransferase family protein [bacterium]